MKKLILVFIALISLSAQAKFLTTQEFSTLTDSQKVEVLKEYKKFLSEQSFAMDLDEKVSLKMISFIDEAMAADGFDCFFAGWPSKLRSAGGRKLCTSPANSNPSYQSQAAKCSGGQMLCQPMLFGDIGCIPAATKAQKNLAFSSCERKFQSSGKNLADVARELSDADKSAAADEVFSLVSSVCTSGPQSVKPMCKNLQNRVAAIKAARPAVIAKPSAPAAPQAGVPAAGAAVAGTSAANTPVPAGEGEEGETPVAGTAEVVPKPDSANADLTRTVAAVTNGLAAATTAGEIPCDAEGFPVDPSQFKKQSCAHASIEGLPATVEDLTTQLNDYGVEVLEGNSPKVENLQAFLAELKKFPESLYNEMKGKGAKIRIFEGEGVASDNSPNSPFPRAAADGDKAYANRQAASTATTVQTWDTIPGSGGSVQGSPQQPTRIVVNHLYDRHGSANLVLHEHAHNLDDLYGRHAISKSNDWKILFNHSQTGPRIKTLLEKVCANNYCTGEGKNDQEKAESAEAEGFAELFAYYNSCDKAKESVKKFLPELATFFDNLKNAKQYLETSKRNAQTT